MSKLKTARIEARGRSPGEECLPGALVSREAVDRQVPSARGLEQIGEQPARIAPKRRRLYIFPKQGGILHSRSSVAITALIVHLLLGVLERSLRVPKNTLTGGPQPLESLEPIEGRLG